MNHDYHGVASPLGRPPRGRPRPVLSVALAGLRRRQRRRQVRQQRPSRGLGGRWRDVRGMIAGNAVKRNRNELSGIGLQPVPIRGAPTTRVAGSPVAARTSGELSTAGHGARATRPRPKGPRPRAPCLAPGPCPAVGRSRPDAGAACSQLRRCPGRFDWALWLVPAYGRPPARRGGCGVGARPQALDNRAEIHSGWAAVAVGAVAHTTHSACRWRGGQRQRRPPAPPGAGPAGAP